MVDFVLGRIRFKFKGNWATSTAYLRDDVITYGGRSYVCLSNHTSDSSASGGFYTDSANWELMTDGIANKGSWTPSTYYKVNDLVKFGSRIYIATSGHTANSTANSGFYSDSSNWQLLNDGIQNFGTWTPSRYYKINDIVKFGARSYIALTGHTSDSTANSGFYTDLTASKWQMLNDGMENRGSWASGTYYRINDIVKWGSELYICNAGHTAGTNWVDTESNFTLLVGGLEFEDSYNGSTLYQPGDIVRYGGYQFVATNETTGNLPTDTNYWDLLSTGFSVQDEYNAGTAYKPGDVVRYGGYTYVAKTDTTGNAPNNNTYWTLVVRGIKYNGNYNSGSTYQLGDTVFWNGSSWIANTNNVVGITPQPTTNAYWSILTQGSANNVLTTLGDILYQSASGLERLPVGANGQVLSIYAGVPNWEDNSYANNVFYVSPTGTDDASFGKTPQRPFKTIKFATGHVANTAGAGTRTTIFVRDGVYSEQLPITVPANTAIMGDSQRTVVVQPAGGNDDTGTKLNTQSTMWYVSDGVLLKQMTFVGMIGFTPGSPEDDITAATVGGVFVRFNPSSPITTKSPYILECSAISNGGIGVIVDGSIHGSGYKSMVFHAYTNLNNDGVGYWVKDNGRAEIVSCFSYYCWFGLATSGGGFIRGLNNNNSYGRYGAVSRGYDTIETPHYGKIYGSQLQFSAGSTMAFNVGEFITGGTSSANGLITNVQAAANKLYYWPVSGTFQNSEVVTGVTSAVTATTTSSGVTGQKGYVIVANGFNDEPKPGRSIQFSDDANNAYVIQSVSGTYSDSNSRIVIVLAQEKTIPSSNAANVVIRANFSQIRLTGHDFLDIGTGNTATANVPGVPSLAASQANEVVEYKPGRVYYVSTDQNGNFRVGEYFKIDQATGRATLDASAFDLSGLTSLKLGSIGAQLGETINEFSSDVTLGGDSNQAVPTEHAVKAYVDGKFTIVNVTSNVALTQIYYAANTQFNANGYVTVYVDNNKRVANVVYNANNSPTSWVETFIPSNTTYTYTVTYFANNMVNTITRS